MRVRKIRRSFEDREVIIRLLGRRSLRRNPNYYFGLIIRFLETQSLQDSCSWYYNPGGGGVYSCTIRVPENVQSASGYPATYVITEWAKRRSWTRNVEVRYQTKEIRRTIYDLAR